VALLALAQAERRLPYKAGKTTTYWKGVPREERCCRLISQSRDIVRMLDRYIDGVDLLLPDKRAKGKTLKETEDMIDSLVCALGRRSVR
jgi:hypothetical protein